MVRMRSKLALLLLIHIVQGISVRDADHFATSNYLTRLSVI